MVKGPPSLLAWSLVGQVPWEGNGMEDFGIPPWGEEGQAQGSRDSRVPERLSRL